MNRVNRRRSLDRGTIDELRARLIAARRTLFHVFEGVEADLHAIEEDRESEWLERAQEEAAKRLLARLDDRERTELEEIQHALGKIAAGLYGACESCRAPIDAERLRAIPAARLCLACKQRKETTAASGIAGAAEAPVTPGREEE